MSELRWNLQVNVSKLYQLRAISDIIQRIQLLCPRSFSRKLAKVAVPLESFLLSDLFRICWYRFYQTGFDSSHLSLFTLKVYVKCCFVDYVFVKDHAI